VFNNNNEAASANTTLINVTITPSTSPTPPITGSSSLRESPDPDRIALKQKKPSQTRLALTGRPISN
jgi:hypothetical protein